MILDRIIENKKEELQKTKKSLTISQLEKLIQKVPHPRSFEASLKKDIGGKNRIIAEVKKASPSKGIIRERFIPVEIARDYEAHGAVAVSVLTEKKFFLGNLDYIPAIKKNISLPVLRKDFIVDPYQIYEARAFEADALLLIAGVLTGDQLKEFLQLVKILFLSALVEIHTRDELATALDAGASIIGINNRNLSTFTTNIKTTLELIADIPDDVIVVSESGINSADDILILKKAGVDAFLIGEALMRDESPGDKLLQFTGALN
ncbi:MAG: indole-3-glycerol phosphate synthase TrpC [Pseudomonadota bacterium]